MKTTNITPAKFRCGETVPTCPSIHKTEHGDFILTGDFVSLGEMKNANIPIAKGESAIRWSSELMDAFMIEYAAQKLTK